MPSVWSRPGKYRRIRNTDTEITRTSPARQIRLRKIARNTDTSLADTSLQRDDFPRDKEQIETKMTNSTLGEARFDPCRMKFWGIWIKMGGKLSNVMKFIPPPPPLGYKGTWERKLKTRPPIGINLNLQFRSKGGGKLVSRMKFFHG